MIEKYFFDLQKLYARKARIRIDAIRATYGKDGDIPDVIEQRLVNNIEI